MENKYQQHLKSLELQNEANGWLEVSHWSNHRLLLILGLSLTKGDVIEYGSGDGSTSYLRNYCYSHNRNFFSYDYSKEWAEKTGSIYIPDWEAAEIWNPCGLCFIDHSPGEDRAPAIRRMIYNADVIVVHDSELNGGGDYKLEPEFKLFRYNLHYNRTGGGAGASMVSNKIDVTKYCGLEMAGRKFDAQ